MSSVANDAWILAFDASCCHCRRLADKVGQASGHKVEIRPLADPDIATWRRQALGADAPPAPTLISVRAGDVRAWTGVAMATRLALRLGPRTTLHVLASLGELRREIARPDTHPVSGTLRRAQFLRLSGLGVVAVVFGGKAAQAAPRALTPDEEWVRANQASLPHRYREFITHDMSRRKAIYAALDPGTRSGLWQQQLRDYRLTHPEVTAFQRRLIDRAETLTGRQAIFSGNMDEQLHQELDELRQESIAVFGMNEARALFATLGPPVDFGPPADARRRDCECNCISDWCWPGYYCNECCLHPEGCYCNYHDDGCGTMWAYPCNGICH